jgi:hypothetical protein
LIEIQIRAEKSSHKPRKDQAHICLVKVMALDRKSSELACTARHILLALPLNHVAFLVRFSSPGTASTSDIELGVVRTLFPLTTAAEAYKKISQ